MQGLLTHPLIQQTLIQLIVGAIAGLIKAVTQGPTPPPAAPPTRPTPVPVQPDPSFPDDFHPAPPQARTVGSVRLRLARAQYSRERFPEEYTDENPFGLVPQEELRKIQAGSSALPFGSKFWLDLTPFDEAGKQITRPEMIALDLSFITRHQCGQAFIQGMGETVRGSGEPNSYTVVDTDAVSNGITAWKSSLGYLHQMKAWGEGSFDVYGSVARVESEHFTLKVS